MNAKQPKMRVPWKGWKLLAWIGVFTFASFIFFPRGPLGIIDLIFSYLPPHSRSDHGSYPQEFEGLWVHWDAAERKTAAFALHEDGQASSTMGLISYRWHFDDDKLFIETFSLCGNGWHAAPDVREYSVVFDGPDRMTLTAYDDAEKKFGSPVGTYARTVVTEDFRENISSILEQDDADWSETFFASQVGWVIKQSEHWGFDYSEEIDG